MTNEKTTFELIGASDQNSSTRHGADDELDHCHIETIFTLRITAPGEVRNLITDAKAYIVRNVPVGTPHDIERVCTARTYDVRYGSTADTMVAIVGYAFDRTRPDPLLTAVVDLTEAMIALTPGRNGTGVLH